MGNMGSEFDDDFFQAYFPNTKHFYDGDVSYDYKHEMYILDETNNFNL